MKNESIEGTIERYRRLRAQEKELKNLLSTIKEKLEELSERAPRFKAAADGKHSRGTMAYQEPGDEKVRYALVDEAQMSDLEKEVDKLESKYLTQKREKQKELEVVQKELTFIESRFIDEGIPLAVLEKKQVAPRPPARRGPKPKDEVARRCEIVLEETAAATKKEMGRLMRKKFMQKRVFQRLDNEKIPLLGNGRGYEADDWMGLFATREHTSAADNVRRYLEKNWDRYRPS